MNAQEYRKQLLIQQIESHRGLVRLELERVKDLNPARPFLDLGQQVLGLAGQMGSGRRGGGGGLEIGALPGLNLGVILPIVIKLATSVLRRWGKRRK